MYKGTVRFRGFCLRWSCLRGLRAGVVVLALLTACSLAQPTPVAAAGEAATPTAVDQFDTEDGLLMANLSAPLSSRPENPGKLEHLPRFRYVVRRGDRLSEIAGRFGSSLPWIQGANPHLVSVHTIFEGEELLIPVDFPLPDGARMERMEVLQDRFLGSYRIDRPFTDVEQLLTWQLNALREKGFDAAPDENGVERGITLRGRGVVLGKLVFTPPGSAAGSDDTIQVDIGLLFSDAQEDQSDLLNDFRR